MDKIVWIVVSEIAFVLALIAGVGVFNLVPETMETFISCAVASATFLIIYLSGISVYGIVADKINGR